MLLGKGNILLSAQGVTESDDEEVPMLGMFGLHAIQSRCQEAEGREKAVLDPLEHRCHLTVPVGRHV